jgi:hypothetical protein
MTGIDFRITGNDLRMNGIGFRMTGREIRTTGIGFRMTGNQIPITGDDSRITGNRFRMPGMCVLPEGGGGFWTVARGLASKPSGASSDAVAIKHAIAPVRRESRPIAPGAGDVLGGAGGIPTGWPSVSDVI